VLAARRELERLGQIPAHACGKPAPPRGPRPSRTREAIEAGCITPRQVADAAGVSIQAAWKALRSIRPPSGLRPCAPGPGAPARKTVELPPGWQRESRAAVALCLRYCPALAQCRIWARLHPELPGVVAGLDQSERAAGLARPRTPPRRIKPSKPLLNVLRDGRLA
jgi:hypothetical protein